MNGKTAKALKKKAKKEAAMLGQNWEARYAAEKNALFALRHNINIEKIKQVAKDNKEKTAPQTMEEAVKEAIDTGKQLMSLKKRSRQ